MRGGHSLGSDREFDISSLAGAEQVSLRRMYGMGLPIAGLVIGGLVVEEGVRFLFVVDRSHADQLTDAAWVLGGSLIMLGGVAGYLATGRNQIERIRIGPSGITLVRGRGKAEAWGWADAGFRVDLCRLERPASEVVPRNDIRRISPIWLEGFRGSRKSPSCVTLLTSEICADLLAEAHRRGMSVVSVPSAYYGQV